MMFAINWLMANITRTAYRNAEMKFEISVVEACNKETAISQKLKNFYTDVTFLGSSIHMLSSDTKRGTSISTRSLVLAAELEDRSGWERLYR